MKSSWRARHFRAAFVVVAAGLLLIACGDVGGGATPSPSASASAPPSPAAVQRVGPIDPGRGPHALAGEVFAFSTGQLAGAEVHVGVRYEADFDFFARAAAPAVRADGLGQFNVPDLPPTSVSVYARVPGYQQPCAVLVDVPGNVPARIEMIREADLLAAPSARPQSSRDPVLRGRVYEVTADGNQPVEGVELWVEQLWNVMIASTRSGAGGGFLLCNLPADVALVVSKPGYALRRLRVPDPGAADLEIELVRAAPDPRGLSNLGDFVGDRVTTAFSRPATSPCTWTLDVGAGRTQVAWKVMIDGASIDLDQDLANLPTDNTPFAGALRGTAFRARYSNDDAATLACGFRESILLGEFYDDFSAFIATEWLTWGEPGKEIRSTQTWVVRRRER